MIGISIGIPDGNGPPGDPTATGGASWSGATCTSIEKRTRIANDYHFPEGFCNWDLPGDPGAGAILTANRYGYRITGTHTFGDKGFLRILDAYEEASLEDPVQGRRFALDHGSLVSPEVIAAAAKQDVIWSLQPPQFWGRSAPGVSKVFGEEYAHQWVMPVKSLMDAGMRVTYGADLHRDPERQPMFNLEVLVTRVTRDGHCVWPEGENRPGQRSSHDDSLGRRLCPARRIRWARWNPASSQIWWSWIKTLWITGFGTRTFRRSRWWRPLLEERWLMGR